VYQSSEDDEIPVANGVLNSQNEPRASEALSEPPKPDEIAYSKLESSFVERVLSDTALENPECTKEGELLAEHEAEFQMVPNLHENVAVGEESVVGNDERGETSMEAVDCQKDIRASDVSVTDPKDPSLSNILRSLAMLNQDIQSGTQTPACHSHDSFILDSSRQEIPQNIASTTPTSRMLQSPEIAASSKLTSRLPSAQSSDIMQPADPLDKFQSQMSAASELKVEVEVETLDDNGREGDPKAPEVNSSAYAENSCVEQLADNELEPQEVPLGMTIHELLRENYGAILKVIGSVKEYAKCLTLESGLHFRLPRIVLCGSESSGKSTVLNRLLGISALPTGSQLTTLAPIHVLLSPKRDNCVVFAEMETNEASPIPITNEAELHETLKTILGSLNGKANANPIRVTVFGDFSYEMEFVDLPGLMEGYVASESQVSALLVENITRDYIKDKRNLIVATVPCIQRIRSNTIWKHIQEQGAMKRTVCLITKLDKVPIFVEATQKIRGDHDDCAGIEPIASIGLYSPPSISLEKTAQKEIQFLQHNNPDLITSFTGGIGSVQKLLYNLFSNHILYHLPSVRKQMIHIRSMAVIQQKTLGKVVDECTIHDFKSHLLSFSLEQDWEPLFSQVRLPKEPYPTVALTTRVSHAQDYFHWQQQVLSTLKRFCSSAGKDYIEMCFTKLRESTNDEWKTFRFKEIWSIAQSTIQNRLLGLMDYTELETKFDYISLHDETIDSGKMEKYLKKTVAMLLYKQVVHKFPGELFQFVSQLHQFREDSHYREKRRFLDSIVQLCESVHLMVPDEGLLPHELGLFELDNDTYSPPTALAPMETTNLTIEESPEKEEDEFHWKPVKTSEKFIDRSKKRDFISVARVRTKPSKSETPASSGTSGVNSFAYAHEPSPPKYFSTQREPRRRRFTADTDLFEEENPFSLPSIQRQLPSLKPSLLDTRQPTRTVYRSIFKK
jgi:GTP-binding protein EngB required for normal cell division